MSVSDAIQSMKTLISLWNTATESIQRRSAAARVPNGLAQGNGVLTHGVHNVEAGLPRF